MKKSLNFARYCPYKSKYTHIKKVAARNVHGKSLKNILIKKLIKMIAQRRCYLEAETVILWFAYPHV